MGICLLEYKNYCIVHSPTKYRETEGIKEFYR